MTNNGIDEKLDFIGHNFNPQKKNKIHTWYYKTSKFSLIQRTLFLKKIPKTLIKFSHETHPIPNHFQAQSD